MLTDAIKEKMQWLCSIAYRNSHRLSNEGETIIVTDSRLLTSNRKSSIIPSISLPFLCSPRALFHHDVSQRGEAALQLASKPTMQAMALSMQCRAWF